MVQEDNKDLLLKYLSMALPYGVKVAIEYSKGKYTHIYDLKEIDNDATSELRQQVTVWNYGFYSSVISYPLINCRPYLRPMQSMTEEEKEEYQKLIWTRLEHYVVFWLLEHYFDFMGLIPKGLAIEVTERNNPYK